MPDFIRKIIDEDLKNKKNNGNVITRLPPESNSYLSIARAFSTQPTDLRISNGNTINVMVNLMNKYKTIIISEIGVFFGVEHTKVV